MSISGSEINAILSAIKKGEISKLQELHDATSNKLKYVALMYAKDKNDWGDIVNYAFYRVHKYIYKFKPSMDGYNWLCKIVQNTANTFNKDVQITVPLDKITFTEIIGDCESIYETDELAKELVKLEESDQNIIYLKIYAGFSYSEIAKILHSKKSTVYKRFQTLAKDILKNLKYK